MEAVDIVIINKNMEETIGDAIRSVLNQTHKEWNLIIADGGSTDKSIEIAKSFKDSRIKLFIDPCHVAYRFTKCFNDMDSPYLVYLASDDQLDPLFLEKNVEVMQNNPDVDVIYNSYTRNTFNNKMELLGSRQERLSTPTEGCLMNNYFMGVFWMFRRSIYQKVGSFDSPMGGAYDYAFALACEFADAKFYYLDKLLGWYRHWHKSESVYKSPQMIWKIGEDTREYERNRRANCK